MTLFTEMSAVWLATLKAYPLRSTPFVDYALLGDDILITDKKAIQEESEQFPNPNEVVPPESNEQQQLLRISLRICGTVVESLPMANCLDVNCGSVHAQVDI
ncbi:hypothetical protein H5410_000766 [Solanum commersonii]|uniref:ATP synthase protein MI25 n=1 Tax=Solanum commersonii TaxID=4109 RepID=A0A9J6AXE8_SOLCO|nr:hypothetical protein H5410_000766 [Solanum commersonii]